ncbi:MAG: hypothetical protein CL504_09595 [Actinobacteria bacterium]|nr:hypothetical protein [Actinomycetota bacterium]
MSDKRLIGTVTSHADNSDNSDNSIWSATPSTEQLHALETRLRAATKGGIELKCTDCEVHLCSVRFTVVHLTHIDASVFAIVTDWWARHFPSRSACIVRASGTKTLVVDCPHLPYITVPTRKLVLFLLLHLAALLCLGYLITANFFDPYNAWLETRVERAVGLSWATAFEGVLGCCSYFAAFVL